MARRGQRPRIEPEAKGRRARPLRARKRAQSDHVKD